MNEPQQRGFSVLNILILVIFALAAASLGLSAYYAGAEENSFGIRKFGREAVLATSLYYSMEPDEEAVIQRFGRYVRTEGPGAHFKWPFGIETVRKVRTLSVLKEEFGFSTKERTGTQADYGEDDPKTKLVSKMITGDLNVSDVEWIVQYKISDPRAYLFNIKNVKSALRDLAESAIRQVVGDRSVTEVLTFGRAGIEDETKALLQAGLNQYGAGLHVTTLRLQNVNPPDEVKPSFNAVNSAKQEAEQMINDAWKLYNQVIPQASGQADQTLSEAEGYAVAKINHAQGDVQRFTALQQEYTKSPALNRKRFYLEAMNAIIPKVQHVYIIDPELK